MDWSRSWGGRGQWGELREDWRHAFGDGEIAVKAENRAPALAQPLKLTAAIAGGRGGRLFVVAGGPGDERLVDLAVAGEFAIAQPANPEFVGQR